jgi:putative Ig domain-containing protein
MSSLVSSRRWIAHAFAFLLMTTIARSAGADTLTVAWDPSQTSNVVGYLVYVGTQSGVYSTIYDVGNATSFTYPSAAPGQPYFFAVASYFSGPVIGARSTEVSGTSNAAPVLVNPGNQSSVVGNPVSLQLQGSDPAGQPVSYGVTALPPGLALATATGRISGTPTTAGSYLVNAVVSDGVFSDAKTFTWAVAQPTVTDSAPVITITVPTGGSLYNTDQTYVTLGGTATDNGVVTEVIWTTDRGNSGRASGTESWIAGVPLQRGPNTITVQARDNAGNVSSRAIVVKASGKSPK